MQHRKWWLINQKKTSKHVPLHEETTGEIVGESIDESKLLMNVTEAKIEKSGRKRGRESWRWSLVLAKKKSRSDL